MSENLPRVLMAILAKDKALTLGLYLKCIEAFDYPKDKIFLWVRVNNCNDNTRDILLDWLERVKFQYAGVHFDASDVEIPVQNWAPHEWVLERFEVLCPIREESMLATLKHACDYYFIADCDNLLVPSTLKKLLDPSVQIVAPMLQHPTTVYSNYHSTADPNGYFENDDIYIPILSRRVRGLIAVDVVHCTYLIRADAIPHLTYLDGSNRFDYVILAHSARRAGITQFLNNQEYFGFLTTDEEPETMARARELCTWV